MFQKLLDGPAAKAAGGLASAHAAAAAVPGSGPAGAVSGGSSGGVSGDGGNKSGTAVGQMMTVLDVKGVSVGDITADVIRWVAREEQSGVKSRTM